MGKLKTTAYQIIGPKSVLQRVDLSLGEAEDDHSDMIEEEEEMI